MALIKEIRYINGAVAKYHRISDVMKNSDDVQVLVKSYIDEQTREAEEYWISKKIEYNNAVNAGDMEYAERIRQSIDPRLLHEMLSSNADFSVYTTPIVFSYTEDLNEEISFNALYRALRRTPEFKDAEMN